VIRQIGLCLAATVASAAWGDEMTGIDSPAVDISRPNGFAPNQFAAAFVPRIRPDSRNPFRQFLDRPVKVVVQVRNTDTDRGFVACTQDIALPSGAIHPSHPALSTSGWLFVTAFKPGSGWRLWGLERRPSWRDFPRGFCGGWQGEWQDLGNNGRDVTSAPDAVVVGPYTYIFVTADGGFIDYRAVNGGRPLGWRTVQSIARAGARRAEAKPAVAAHTVGAGTTLHLFWQNGSDILHQALVPMGDAAPGVVWPIGPLTGRPFGNAVTRPNPVLRPIAACTAGPEVVAPAPIFVICGARSGYYYVAHYKDPDLSWDDPDAVETIAGDAWIRRASGSGIASLGGTGIDTAPLMFVTYVADYCPEATRAPPPAPQPVTPCWQDPMPGAWLLQRRWSSLMARYNGNLLSAWQGAERLPIPPAASKLYEW
jgi:hypothetical protein